MSERFPDEVLKRAIEAWWHEPIVESRIAAMRAVLEGHGPDPDRMQATLRDISNLLADAGVPGGTTLAGGVIWLRERAEQARDLATAHLIAVLAELEQDFTESHDAAKQGEQESAKEQDYNAAAQSQTEATGYAYAALRVKRELARLRTASDGSQR